MRMPSSRILLAIAATTATTVVVGPLRTASSADPVATTSASAAASPSAPPTPPTCEEACATAVRALGECELSGGGLLVAIGGAARLSQLDCKGYCATIDSAEVTRIDACFPRLRCEDYRACLAEVGATATRASETTTRERDGAEMITVPAGPFVRGVPRVARALRDVERKTVELPAFRIDRDEVTVARYRRCYAEGGCKPPSVDGEPDPATVSEDSETTPKLRGCNWGVAGRDKHPINCVDYAGARAYCAWVGARLPTELEWEKAARGGDARRYPWGVWDRTCKRLVWDSGNSIPTRGCSKRSTAEVGTYPGGDSPFGVHDMAGNVWEWVGGMYVEGEYADPQTDATLAPGQAYGVVRGGGWGRDDGDALAHDVTTRFMWFKEHRIEGVGFRCAMGAP